MPTAAKPGLLILSKSAERQDDIPVDVSARIAGQFVERAGHEFVQAGPLQIQHLRPASPGFEKIHDEFLLPVPEETPEELRVEARVIWVERSWQVSHESLDRVVERSELRVTGPRSNLERVQSNRSDANDAALGRSQADRFQVDDRPVRQARRKFLSQDVGRTLPAEWFSHPSTDGLRVALRRLNCTAVRISIYLLLGSAKIARIPSKPSSSLEASRDTQASLHNGRLACRRTIVAGGLLLSRELRLADHESPQDRKVHDMKLYTQLRKWCELVRTFGDLYL